MKKIVSIAVIPSAIAVIIAFLSPANAGAEDPNYHPYCPIPRTLYFQGVCYWQDTSSYQGIAPWLRPEKQVCPPSTMGTWPNCFLTDLRYQPVGLCFPGFVGYPPSCAKKATAVPLFISRRVFCNPGLVRDQFNRCVLPQLGLSPEQAYKMQNPGGNVPYRWPH